jgi:CubicO group peptidase (beta-lactamase class C family)
VPIRQYLPRLLQTHGSDAALGDVSVRQLLTHTAGVPLDFACARASSELGQLALSLDEEPLWAPAGAVHGYSNAGYSVLGAVLEAVSGEPFERVVQARVLEPLSMLGVRYGGAADGGEHVAGLDREGRYVGSDADLCRAAQPSGGALASARDLAQLSQLLLAGGGALMSPARFAEMTQGVATGGVFEDERYGLGIKRFRYKGVTVLGHEGLLPHFAAFVGVVPERGLGVVVLVNRATPAMTIALAAIDAVLGLEEGLPAFAPLGRPLDALAGCYIAPTGGLGVVEVRREADELIADMVGPTRALLPPLGTFFPVSASRALYVATALGVGRRVDPAMCESKGTEP